MVNFILIGKDKPKKPQNKISFGRYSLYPGDTVFLSNKNEGTIVKWHDGNVEYEKKIYIPDHKILTFWDMMDELNVWQWKKYYSHPEYTIVDGDMWHLELSNVNGKTIETKGSSYYPRNFKKLIENLNYLFSSNI